MSPRDAYWLWYDFSHIVGGAVSHHQHNVDPDDPWIDWDRQRNVVAIGGLAFACSLLEALGVSPAEPHARILTSIRNAVLHNASDLALNRDRPKSLDLCLKYLSEQRWKKLNEPLGNVTRPFDIVEGSKVSIGNHDLFFFIERVLDSFMSEEERRLPPILPCK